MLESCQVHDGAITVGIVKGHRSKAEFLSLTTDGLLSSKQFQALNLILLATDTEVGHRKGCSGKPQACEPLFSKQWVSWPQLCVFVA